MIRRFAPYAVAIGGAAAITIAMRYVVAQIRKKLGDDPANPTYIVNEPGVGYRLQA